MSRLIAVLIGVGALALAQVEEAWVARYNGPLSRQDEAQAVAVDAAGNSYVTGWSLGSGTDRSYVTAKYDGTTGGELWVAWYNGPGNGEDLATAIALDPEGNVYVTGYSTGTGRDYATVKYDGMTGAQLWVAHYNGPGNGNDIAQAIVSDGSGNVIVTGRSAGDGSSDDYATVKYDGATGAELWVARYNGSANGIDIARAIVLDGAGNVIVTGGSAGGASSDDYATVKYDGATGAELWVARYNGPGNAYDVASAVAVDAAGSVFVTGTSGGSGTYRDYATLKYNGATGAQVWVARHDGGVSLDDVANALAVDPAGDVIVTGGAVVSGKNQDFVTIKYDGATGNRRWIAIYDGPGGVSDEARALALDADGSVYVTGGSADAAGDMDYATVKYNGATGAELWVMRYDGPANGLDQARAIALSPAGDAIVTGYSPGTGTGRDYATVKYNGATGAELWVARLNGPGSGFDEARAIATDAAGDVFVTGSSRGDGTGFDYATVKYDGANGAELWVARYDGPGNDGDWARAIAVDAAGDVFVTGWSLGAGTGRDYATVKYDGATGAELWVARYNGPVGDGADLAVAIAVDATGDVFVTGRSEDPGTDLDYATVKYDGATGAELWVARYNGPGYGADAAQAIAVDKDGNVFVTGSSRGIGTSLDYATVKYDGETGAELWVARYDGPGNRDDVANAIAVEAAGAVYVTGTSRGSGTGDDYATVKYDGATGAELWVARYDGPAGGADDARALALSPAGAVFVTGLSRGEDSDDDYATVKYDGATGAELWVTRYNGPGNARDRAFAIVPDWAGDVYVTGVSRGDGTGDDYATVKYDGATGTERWVIRYDGPVNGTDAAFALTLDRSGKVVVTGVSAGAGTGEDYATVKYEQSVGVETGAVPGGRVPVRFGPNPLVGGFLYLSYDLPDVGPVMVRVFSISGREVLRLTPAGARRTRLPLDLRALASGVYLVRLEAPGFGITEKLVVQN